MAEYNKIRQMYHQLHLLKENKKVPSSQYKVAREMIESVAKTIPLSGQKLLDALNLSKRCLTKMQVEEENAPLKKIALDNMNGAPVWVVSYDHDGRWGIVNVRNQSVLFPTADGVEEEFWFDDRYIFRHKKEIKDYTQELREHGIEDH